MSSGNLTPIESTFGETHSGGVNPLRKLLDALHGRWMIAFVVGAVLAGLLGAGGYYHGSQNISYTSQGVVQVVQTRRSILYETELNQRDPDYDAFRSLQARLIQSQRLLSKAIEVEYEDPDRVSMRDLGWPQGQAGLRKLIKSLRVLVPRSENVILVSITDDDPVVAQVAVNAVLTAYEQLSGDTAAAEFTTLERELIGLRDQYRRQRDDAREAILNLAEQYGTDDLERRRESKGTELDRLDRRIRELQIAQAMLPPKPEGDEPEAEASETPSSVEALASYDPQLASLVSRLNQIELEIRSNSDQLGAEHPQMQRLERDRTIMSDLVNERAGTVRERLGGESLAGPRMADGSASRANTERQLVQLRALRESLAGEVLELGRVQLRIDHEKQRSDEANTALAETTHRLEALRVEQGDANQRARIEVVTRGDQPLRPDGDNKQKFAGMGALGGAVLGVGLVALPGLIRPKYRSIGQLALPDPSYTVLGVMPELDAGGAAGDELARLNLHQIRVLLESARVRAGGSTEAYLMTSATAGEGKTSLVIALASAYSNAGMSVVLVDADLVGRSLTAQLSTREVDGVLQWIRAGNLIADPPVHSTPVPGVVIVPCGRDNGLEPEALGPRQLTAMIDLLKQRFDVVLVDSGPVLGSTEAAAAVSACDETVLVIGRGQRESLVKAARDRLERLGATRVGIVFNRADRDDLEKNPTSATSVGMSQRSRPTEGRPRSLAVALAMGASGTGDE